MNVTLAFTAATLFGIGTTACRSTLTRILIGIALVTHGANVLLMELEAGTRIIGTGDPADFSDPAPQALALTAIVISFGVSALLLALAYPSRLLTHDDEVQDDVADRAIAQAWPTRRSATRNAGTSPTTCPTSTSRARAREPPDRGAHRAAPGRRRPVDPAGPIPLQRAISMTVLTTNLVVAIALLVVVDRDGTLRDAGRGGAARSRSSPTGSPPSC